MRFVGGEVHARDAVNVGVLVGVRHALLHCLVQFELDSEVGVLDVALSVDVGGVWVGDHLHEREERELASNEEVDAVALMVISIVVAGANSPPASMLKVTDVMTIAVVFAGDIRPKTDDAHLEDRQR